MKPAARFSDPHTCPTHTGGPAQSSVHDVLINGLLAVGAGDVALCDGPTDYVTTGAELALVRGKLMARVDSHTMHGGLVVDGSPNVFVGGASGGGTVGGGEQAQAECAALAATRNPPAGMTYPAWHPKAGQQIPPNQPDQSGENCGPEAARALINRRRRQQGQPPISEERLYDETVDKGWTTGSKDPDKRVNGGGTGPEGRRKILENYGVESELHPQSDTQGLFQRVADGHGVITAHDTGKLWNNPNYEGQGHAVSIVGIEYDGDGNPKNVIVSDTGKGECASKVPADRFQKSLLPDTSANVTKDKVY